MEILSHGKYFEDYTYMCRTCGCIFRFEPKDIQRVQYKDRSTQIFVICPECKASNFLNKGD